MDLSVIAAIGSFFVSERVLKPKATVLVILGCVLVYDLTTKTRDPSSLRIYRGPALFAFTLMMASLSLRTWRRNGVACDELLFLPGTTHGIVHGVEGIPGSASTKDEENGRKSTGNEGDLSAGGTTTLSPISSKSIELQSVVNVPIVNEQKHSHPQSVIEDKSVSSSDKLVISWEGDEENDTEEQPLRPLSTDSDSEALKIIEREEPENNRFFMTWEEDESSHEVSRNGQLSRNHPRVTRVGAFFFFRSSQSTTHNAEYAPSGPAVFGAALDLSIPILFNFHLFIEAFNHYGDSIASKTLPLIFLSVLIMRSWFPLKRRFRFWNTVSFICRAPYQQARFRDSYLGDVFTSLVRPCQDIVFAISYYLMVIWGTFTGRYGLNKSGEILEQSWILMNVILPAVSLLPMWFKFLQTLRECYDTGKRWPHLGNAFKYLSASLVILHGITHPEDRRSFVWIMAFAICLLYQIFWDTFIDWELFVVVPRSATDDYTDCDAYCLVGISSVRPTSRILLVLQRHIIQPICDFAAKLIRLFPSLRQIQLRPRRLYKTSSFYWRIFCLNSLMRFTWMLCFIPAYHLTSRDQMHASFSSDTITYVGVFLPVAEIFRRTLWGLLCLELKTIKMIEDDPTCSTIMDTENLGEISSINKSFHRESYIPFWLRAQHHARTDKATTTSSSHLPLNTTRFDRIECSENMQNNLFIAELSAWVLMFVGFGLSVMGHVNWSVPGFC